MQIPDLSNIPDLKPVEPGEYDIRVKKASDTTSNGRKGIMLVCDIVDVNDADTLFHTIWMPKETEDEGKQNIMYRMVKDFIVAVGLDPSNVATQDFEGLEFSAFLDIDEYEGREKNVIKRIV